MKSITSTPKVEFIKDKSPNKGQVIIEPCYPGYGTTLGNSIRRIMLSSLNGAAVVGVKIQGADHEFMALPHIKEDVLQIILNLKKLRLKIFSDEIIKLEIETFGEKEVRASDIKKNSQVEIINPDLILAHITDMAGKLNMEIFVSAGRGYETIESRETEEKHEIGYIGIDSIFSPVLVVGMNIENVRVGKMINWDKLILDITTDGTISSEEAFKQAVEIAINQFSSLVEFKAKEDKELEVKINEETKGEIKEGKEKLSANVQEKEKAKEATEAAVGEAPKRKRGRPKKIQN